MDAGPLFRLRFAEWKISPTRPRHHPPAPDDLYTISDDPGLLDLDVVHRYLATESYWARGIPRETVERSARHSLCFGVYHHEALGRVAQVGFARVLSDRATFAYLADVFILPAHRGRGLSKRLLRTIFAHPELQGLRRWALATRDAHGLYRQFGFEALAKPENRMHRPHPPPNGLERRKRLASGARISARYSPETSNELSPMKIRPLPSRVLPTTVLAALLLLLQTGCDKEEEPALAAPGSGTTVAPKNPGPHSTILVDTTLAGEASYQDPAGDGSTLDITLPALDREYRDPADHRRYKPIELTIGTDAVPLPNVHNVVVVRMTPPKAGTPPEELVKMTPVVIVRTRKGGATGAPAPAARLAARPMVILNLLETLPLPGPDGQAISYPVPANP